jgi:hypothetical protein
MTAERRKKDRKNAVEPSPAARSSRQPHRVHLPGFVPDEEVGLGNVIKRATTLLGVRPCPECAQRAARLNRRIVFTRGRGR